MRIRVVILAALISSQLLFAQSAGNTGMAFLKLGSGARNVALGDNGMTMANDASAIFYNPANLALNQNQEVFIAHNTWLQDASSEVLGVKLNFFGLPIGVGINATTIRGFDIRTQATAEKDGSFDIHYFSGAVSSGFNITDQIIGGIAVKYLYEGIYVDEADGIGLDLGVRYNNLFPDFSMACAIKNIGSMTKLKNEKTVLPTEFKLGGAYTLPEYFPKFDFNAGVEFQKYLKDDNEHLNFGLETVYDKMFSIRLGYMTNYEAKGFCGGIGVTWHSITFDYAFTPYSLDLGNGNTFSLKIGL
jgi:hypothetical protein